MTTPHRQPRRTQVTNAERQAIWETLLYRSINGKLAHGQYTAVGRLFGLNYRVVQRIWERGISSMRTRTAAVVKSRAYKRGCIKRDRAAACQAIRAVPVDARKNQRILQFAAGLSSHMIQQLLREGFLRHCLKQTRPLLTLDHRIMRISSQPAQSPDLNVLDLGFFNSIQSLQDRSTPRTEEQLIAEVERAYWASSPETLNKTFLTLQYMMEHIMKHEGKNDFRLGHIKKDALLRADKLPVSLSCDPATYTGAIDFLERNPRMRVEEVVEDVIVIEDALDFFI